MKLTKVLYYLGTECVKRKRFKDVHPEKFDITLELGMVQALACALYLDIRHGQVWVLQESAVVLLEDNSQAPKIAIPGKGTIVIRVLAQVFRGALELPVEFLFERLDFCSHHRVRWVAHHQKGAFIKDNDYRGSRCCSPSWRLGDSQYLVPGRPRHSCS